jgi:hypothetical protein
MNLISDGSAVDHDRVGYLFGLLAQSVHYIRLKSNFITDLAARYLLKYPDEMPKKDVCGFEDSGPASLASRFTFSAPGVSVEGEEVDLFREIVDASQALAAASTIDEVMELEERILVYTRQEDAVAKAKLLLVSMFERFEAKAESSSCFDRMISTLVNKLSIVSLTWLVLLMSYDMPRLQLPHAIKQVDVNDLKAKDLPKTLIVQDSTGELNCLSVSVATKAALWDVLIEVLVKVLGDGTKGAFDRMFEEGEKIPIDEKKKSKKKKSKFDFLVAFADARVSHSCLIL